MTTLLRRLTRSLNPHCPLLWRIYLQLISVFGDDKTLKNTWYLALEACPWVKVSSSVNFTGWPLVGKSWKTWKSLGKSTLC